jgi:potassium efflux system protein
MDLFFYYADREVLKERFMTGKFWYGIFIMSSLILFLAAGIYCGAHLWGFKLTIHEMLLWLDHPFYTPLDASGNPVKVTVWSIVYIAMYLLGGYIVAYCVNTFVIARMLDPVIVESGVQNTFLTLSRYLIITLAVFMGLASTGLEGLTTKIAILLAGISFAVQDVVRDFFSYFILLVQRPVKVGDFICVLDGLSTSDNVSLMGFVRSITPRSIVVRKSNSTTLIIPNSRVVLNPIKNWSYTRGFFAFDDMRIVVPYGSDPSVVKQLIAEVLDRNPHILKNPAPIIRLDDFIDNGFSFLVRGFLTSNRIGDQWDIAADVRLNIVKILREQGIEIASPVRTIRIAEPGDRAKLLNMFSMQKPADSEERSTADES